MKEEPESKGAPFFDTNVLVYAYTEPDTVKGRLAAGLLVKIFEGKAQGTLSNQVLAELANALLSKFDAEKNDVEVVIRSLLLNKNWIKINYNGMTVAECLKFSRTQRARLFDALITQTMKDNGVSKIITENTKDFDNIEGIFPTNPFKRKG